MRKMKHKQGATLLTLVAALGVAVYLNWEYARAADGSMALTETVQKTGAVVEELPAEETAADKNYGEAQLVSLNKDTGSAFFDEARLTRTKSRDEALDTLRKSLKNTGLTDEEKKELTNQLSEQIDNITAENEIETLIKAKGFAECVAFIDGERVRVTVMTAGEELSQPQVTRIRDIVLAKCAGVSAQGITVVEVK